jgi:Zn-dependent protease with chaperone function
VTPVLLGALALVLAGPAPALLGRVRAFAQVPRAAVVLWQSVALAAVLAALGSGLALALALVTTQGRAGGLALGPWRIGAHVLVVGLTVTVAARLAWAVVTNARAVRSTRRRQRDLVDLVAGSLPHATNDPVRVLDDETPTVYCVPAVRGSRVVVSAGALARLDASGLAAVLAHERTHLQARHDLVVEVFTALSIAFPRFVRSRVALEQIRTLLEMAADDGAVRAVGRLPMARALVALTTDPTTPPGMRERPAGIDDVAGGGQVLARVERLSERGTGRATRPVLGITTYVAAAGVLVLPTVGVALPWLRAAWRIIA